jgi:hypothetical protein
MTELSRSLLAAAREGLAPDAAVAARVRAKVAAAVGATAATGAAVAIPAKPATSSAAVKLGAALLAVGVVATVVVVAGRERSVQAPALSVPPVSGEDVRTEVRVVAPTEPSRVAPHVRRAEPAHATQPMAASEPHDAPTAASESHNAPTERAHVEPASLSREVELIDLAMVSLRKHAPLAALEAIRVFERETLGHGQMAEDAAAIAIEAHCVLHDDVTAALAAFDRTWPESAQRERIQTACFARK